MVNSAYILKIDFLTLFHRCIFIFAVICLFNENAATKATIEALGDKKLDFDCDSLYYVQDNSNVYKVYGLVPESQTTLSSKKQYNLNVKSEYGGVSGRNPDTIALGPNEKGVLTMYQWDYITYSKEIEYIQKNQASTTVNAFSFDEFVNFTGWSGGEVNQKTGEIYFIGYNQYKLGTEARMMIYNPSTKKVSKSGVLTEENSLNLDFSKYNVESDMAIDADGNAYIMVSNGADFRLIRVVPDKNNPSNWRYSEVQKFALDRSAQIWGMSFLNGMLYVNLNFYIYELNPLSGDWRNTNFLASNSLDFTTCQMAPVIKGKVYLDENGNGILDGLERSNNGVKDVEIEVYNKNFKHLGTQFTNNRGEYNFLLPSAKSTFYIRMKRPQVKGVNSYQTLASGGKYIWDGPNNKGTNTVTPFCYNDTSIPSANYYEKTCYGAKEDGTEYSGYTLDSTNFYSKVIMQTDRAVVRADFALAGVDRSDAPSTFGEISHAMKPSVYLGSGVDADSFSKVGPNADQDKSDDGVEVRLENNASWSSLQNFVFSNNRTYNFRVKVNSNGKQKGFLNAWMAVNATTFSNKIADNLQDTKNSGYVEFNYTIPELVWKTTDNKTKAFFRFRYSTKNVTNIQPANPTGNKWDNIPWVIDGEVEDYMVTYYYVPVPKKVSGNFSVVNQNFNVKAGGKLDTEPRSQTALYTQIANKKFNVKLVHHEYGKVSTNLNDKVHVAIDFVEYNTALQDCDNVKMLKKDVIAFDLQPTQTIVSFEPTLQNITSSGTFKATYNILGSSEKNSTCSDLFAVRPKEFVLDNNFGSNLIGGKLSSGQIRALKNGGGLATDYNQQAKNIIHVNSTLKKPSACELNENVSSEVTIKQSDMKNGLGNIDINYHNVGDIDTIISDKLWASKDRVYNDCLDSLTNEHDANGKVGCDITIKAGLKFVPKALNSTFKISDSANKYTYISSNLSMHANIDMDISAILDDNSTATNYNKDCFAKDVEYGVQLINNNVTGWDNRSENGSSKRIMYIEKTGANITSNNKNYDGLAKLKTTQSNFINGTAHSNFGFNFARPSNPEKPFIIESSDFNITFLQDADDVKGLNPYSGDGSAHMYYGRIHSKKSEYIVPNQNSTNVDIYYEIYCPMLCDRNLYNLVQISNMDVQYPDWYINSDHDISQGNVTEFRVTQGNAKLSKSISDQTPKYYTDVIKDGKETLVVTKNSLDFPHSVTVTIMPNLWLLHDPAFNIIFPGNGGEWAGFGQTNKTDNIGRVLDVNPSKHIKQKVDW
ncbi:MAG: hypothetical protein LBJ88_04615 [Campylobacteraceae bacterium]|jgi:hypothetical protein|nr:hypothetical protein [Campylobacteraceae bacterium]